jgi:heme exporter protein C
MNVVLMLGLLGLLYVLGIGGLALLRHFAVRAPFPAFAWEHPIGAAGLTMLIVGHWLGLFVAPQEVYMGDAARILYVHVPAAWLAMVAFTVAFACALGFLLGADRGWDLAAEAASEVGVVQTLLLLVLGSLFARPTWGVWWTWDPRLVSSAVMLLSFIAVLLLRAATRDPERRATWSSVGIILAYVSIPVTYLAIRWAGIHQPWSETASGSTISDSMRWILYFNTVAFTFVTVWLIARRWRLGVLRARAEEPDPLPSYAAEG